MTTLQNLSSLDDLHCEELHWNDMADYDYDDDNFGSFEEEEAHFMSLISKEKNTHISENVLELNTFFLKKVRREILVWMKRVSSHHNFTLITLVLAINYFDRFVLKNGFQRERPWVTQLVAISCLSLASKFEETHAPLLLDLQVDCKYIFEAKTIKRMELLILSTLKWNMNAVIPFSYFPHLIKWFNLKNHLHWEILTKFESLILSAISDPRYLYYATSVIATVTMIQTLKELGLWKTLQHQIHLIDTFKLNKEKVEECHKFMKEMSSNDKTRKRKCCYSGKNSPTRVLDLDISDTSKESLSISSRTSSDQNVPKKCRTSESYT
ncbi:hypothetical protein RND81_11G216300 [Saponaria officinalis]|uniref:Cyclin-like domain-containing protein n=1 Tax=Saponaria officinalis TaxID=3572 RepID=A0AAW1HPU2_SAPOF